MTPGDARLVIVARARRERRNATGAGRDGMAAAAAALLSGDPLLREAAALLGPNEAAALHIEAWDAAGQPERRDGSADSRIPQVRAPADEVDRVRRAAKLEGVSLTAFVRAALEERAGRVIGLLG